MRKTVPDGLTKDQKCTVAYTMQSADDQTNRKQRLTPTGIRWRSIVMYSTVQATLDIGRPQSLMFRQSYQEWTVSQTTENYVIELLYVRRFII